MGIEYRGSVPFLRVGIVQTAVEKSGGHFKIGAGGLTTIAGASIIAK